MTLSRRSLITGLISLVAAPAIVRVSSLMPVKAMEPALSFNGVPFEFDGEYPMPSGMMELLHERINEAYDILHRTIVADMEKQIYHSTGPGPFDDWLK